MLRPVLDCCKCKTSPQGIGKELYEAMEEFVVNEKARRIYIDTSSTAPYTAARTFMNIMVSVWLRCSKIFIGLVMTK